MINVYFEHMIISYFSALGLFPCTFFSAIPLIGVADTSRPRQECQPKQQDLDFPWTLPPTVSFSDRSLPLSIRQTGRIGFAQSIHRCPSTPTVLFYSPFVKYFPPLYAPAALSGGLVLDESQPNSNAKGDEPFPPRSLDRSHKSISCLTLLHTVRISHMPAKPQLFSLAKKHRCTHMCLRDQPVF